MKRICLMLVAIIFAWVAFQSSDCAAEKIKAETHQPPKGLKFGMSKAEVESTLSINLSKTSHKAGGVYRGKITISKRSRDTYFKFLNDSLLIVTIELESGKNIKSNDYDHYKSVLTSKYGDPTEDLIYSSSWLATDGTFIFLTYDYSSYYNKVWLSYAHPRFLEEEERKDKEESKEF